VGPRTVLDAVVKRKIPIPRRKSNPRTPIVQHIAQRYESYKNRVRTCELDSSGSGQGSVMGFCEHGNRLSGRIKGWECLHYLSDY
jgi:hypothetical protein